MSKTPKFTFRLLGGTHHVGNVVYREGDIIDTDIHLARSHGAHRFKLLKIDGRPAPVDVEPDEFDPDDPEGGEMVDGIGQDVSHQFTQSDGVTVRAVPGTVAAGGGYFVYHGSRLINPSERGVSKGRVNGVIAAFLAEGAPAPAPAPARRRSRKTPEAQTPTPDADSAES